MRRRWCHARNSAAREAEHERRHGDHAEDPGAGPLAAGAEEDERQRHREQWAEEEARGVGREVERPRHGVVDQVGTVDPDRVEEDQDVEGGNDDAAQEEGGREPFQVAP
jgi:hypothetical protein